MEGIKEFIIRKLVNNNVWGGKHIPIDFITKSLPEHFRNTHKGQRLIEKTMKELVNDGLIFVIDKRTGKGSNKHISLNPRKVADIKQYLFKALF